MTGPGKRPVEKAGTEPRSPALEADAFAARPRRRFLWCEQSISVEELSPQTLDFVTVITWGTRSSWTSLTYSSIPRRYPSSAWWSSPSPRPSRPAGFTPPSSGVITPFMTSTPAARGVHGLHLWQVHSVCLSLCFCLSVNAMRFSTMRWRLELSLLSPDVCNNFFYVSLLNCLSVCSFVRSFVRSFIRSFVFSFVLLLFLFYLCVCSQAYDRRLFLSPSRYSFYSRQILFILVIFSNSSQITIMTMTSKAEVPKYVGNLLATPWTASIM